MGRHHHSFLDSLKDFGHQVQHSAPDILKVVTVASKFTPASVIVGVLTNPAIDKAIGSIGNTVIKDVEKAAVGAEHLAGSAYKEVKSVGSGLLNGLMMPLMAVGAIVVIMMLKK